MNNSCMLSGWGEAQALWEKADRVGLFNLEKRWLWGHYQQPPVTMGRLSRWWSQALPSGIRWEDERGRACTKIREAQMICRTNFFHWVLASSRAGCSGRLCSLHHWRVSRQSPEQPDLSSQLVLLSAGGWGCRLSELPSR